MKESDFIDLNQERRLNLQIASLEKEQAMQNNLWPNIEASIVRPEIKYYTAKWIPWAIAASLIISIGSVTFSWNHLRQAEALYAQIDENKSNQIALNDRIADKEKNNQLQYRKSVSYQVEQMEQEYKLAKVELMKIIAMNPSQIEERLLKDIEKTLIDIEHAALTLKAAINQQPDNNNLPLLLKATFQKEISVLTQLAKLDSSI